MQSREEPTYLVTVAPPEVLGADVLVGVLGLLLLRGRVGDVLPVGVPPHLAVDAGNEQAGQGNAAGVSMDCGLSEAAGVGHTRG
jgi:hypothetical protein